MEQNDHSMDGCDADSPEARPPEHRHVSWQARQMVRDHEELAAMSEADLRHYSGTPYFPEKSKS